MSEDGQDTAQARLERLLSHFGAHRFAEAARLATVMDADREWHPLQAVIMAYCGVQLDDGDLFARGLDRVRMVCAVEPANRANLRQFDETILMVHACDAYKRGQNDVVLRLLDISREINPELARAFDAPVADLLARPVIAKLSAQAPSTAPLRFEAPDKPRGPRRALLMMRKFFYGPGSREHDIGPRMRRGFERAGWTAKIVDPGFEGRSPVEITAAALIDLVFDFAADVVVIDNYGIPFPILPFNDFLAAVRRHRPATKVVFVNFDPWIKEQWTNLRAVAPTADLIWSHFPALEIWQSPELRDRTAFIPFPVGIGLDEVPKPTPEPVSVFQGAVEWYNASRAYWLGLLQASGAPFERRVTGHQDDGLDPIESYKRYFSRLQSAQRQVSLSLRIDGSRIITGRSFEAIYAGACLIQERTQDMDYYFLPSVHYLSFTTFDELRGILEMLDANPDLAQAIAARGQEHYLRHYDDPKLIAYLDRMLFGA